MQKLEVQYQADHGRRATAHLRVLTDMSELLDIGERADRATGDERYGRSSLREVASFAGSVSMAETIELGRYGWSAGVEKVRRVIDQIDVESLSMGSQPLPSMIYDVTGDQPDIGRYLSGEPENMILWDTARRPSGRTIEFIVGGSVSGDMPAGQILMNGAAVAAAAKALEAKGHSVGITAAFPISAGHPTYEHLCYFVPLLEPGQYFDLDSITFGLANPSVFRRLILAAMEFEQADLRVRFGAYSGGTYGYREHVRLAPASDRYDDRIITYVRYDKNPATIAQYLVDAAIGREKLASGNIGTF